LTLKERKFSHKKFLNEDKLMSGIASNSAKGQFQQPATSNTQPRKAIICGTGFYAPEKVVKNQYFNDLYKQDVDTFLREKRNIFERRHMDPSQRTSDLILPAANEALQNSGITAQDLDLIIIATDTPDYLSPSTAAVVQHRLGATRAGTFDVNTACAGFVTALDIASKYIMADERYQNILVVGAYGMSKHLDWADYKIATLFADGAGAAVVRPAPQGSSFGVLASQLYTDGQYHDYMGIYSGGTAMPTTHEVIDRKDHLLKFPKRIPPETNGIHWPKLAQTVLDRIGCSPANVDHYILTQFNIASIHETLDALKVDRSRGHVIMDRFGYTGSASIPMAIADAARAHKLKKGDLILLIGSGGGMSMAALAMTWGYDT
jgi:3-oxoacyl-[acyl-carrier-protein] synthase-3